MIVFACRHTSMNRSRGVHSMLQTAVCLGMWRRLQARGRTTNCTRRKRRRRSTRWSRERPLVGCQRMRNAAVRTSALTSRLQSNGTLRRVHADVAKRSRCSGHHIAHQRAQWRGVSIARSRRTRHVRANKSRGRVRHGSAPVHGRMSLTVKKDSSYER